MLRLGQLSLKQCYLYKYPGRLNDGHLEEHMSPAAIDADLLLSPCADFIVVKILDVSQQTSECIYALYTSHCFYYFCENPFVFAVERETFEKCPPFVNKCESNIVLNMIYFFNMG